MTSRRASLLVLPLLVAGCAVVQSIEQGFRAVGQWAEGFFSGEGQVDEDGEQQGLHVFYGENGEKRAEGAYVDDVQDGPWTYWYPNGQKEYEGTFVNAKREGLWRYWHPNGNPKSTGRFHDGRERGEWLFWSSRGQIAQRGTYDKGLQSGRWTIFHPDGTRQAQGFFHRGEKVGPWSFWTRDGERREEDFGLPEGVEVVLDTWEDGTPRREGLTLGGRPEGLWVTRHRNGEPRLVGSFENGVPHGTWGAYADTGELLAEGPVEIGRPAGTWRVSGSAADTWSAAGASPAPPFAGEWSAASAAEELDTGALLGTWLAEAASPVPDEALLRPTPEPAPEPDAALLAASEAEPEVPVNAQPWTAREREEFNDYVSAYSAEGEEERSRLSSRYGRRGSRTGASDDGADAPGGDSAKAAQYVGKPLALTTFVSEYGDEIDLEQYRGQKVVLVVLRGFGGGLCVYCTAQTKAYCEAGAFEEFERLGARLLVVFPGSKAGLEAFKRGYAALSDAELPPYGLLYANDTIVGEVMDIEGQKVIPSTFVLDEDGVVRWAYIGRDKADRPAVDDVLQALRDMEPAG